MTIDTAKLREWVNDEYLPMSQMGRDIVKREVNQICDELDQARIRAADNTLMAQHNADLMRELDQAREDLQELEATFKLRWEADMRAIKRWQTATGKKLTWPDHADLVVWLLEQVP